MYTFKAEQKPLQLEYLTTNPKFGNASIGQEYTYSNGNTKLQCSDSQPVVRGPPVVGRHLCGGL